MEVRLLKDGDYENTLVKWWEDNNFTAPPKGNLPDNGRGGFMVHKGEVDICAGFLYQTNSKTAWIEFIVADSHYRESDRGEAIELLVNVISIKAREAGYTNIYTTLTHVGLMARYKKCGYIKGEKCTAMIKIL